MLMGLSWIVVGVIVAYIATKKVNLRGDDPIVDYCLGAAGGFIGGLVFHFFTDDPMSRFNFWTLIFAVIGAVIALTIWHIIRTRGPYKIPTSRRSY
jgi:uncharacterized membrane protein YeaQ/YmgE (transglycosylase-associated protein family)